MLAVVGWRLFLRKVGVKSKSFSKLSKWKATALLSSEIRHALMEFALPLVSMVVLMALEVTGLENGGYDRGNTSTPRHLQAGLSEEVSRLRGEVKRISAETH
eukprot:5866666-Amphidinium_carterae.1